MTGLKEYQEFEQVIQKMAPQSKLLRAWELKGGISLQWHLSKARLRKPLSEMPASKRLRKKSLEGRSSLL